MKELLTERLKLIYNIDDDYTCWHYREDVNKDALSRDWLDKGTSYIYKVAIVLAIDSNKCDWVYAAIGTQRGDKSSPICLGTLHFAEGENDDMGRTIKRALELMQYTHGAFDF